MISPPFRIVAILPPNTPHYFWRDEEIRGPYGPTTRPLFSPLASDAHKFTSQEAAIRFRDHFRSMFPKYRIFIQRIADGSGPHFENEGVQPTIDSEDHRTPVFVEMDGYEHSGVGFIVRPVIRPSGERLWALRPQDCPSIVASQRHTALESAYGSDPVSTVKRAYELWGDLLQPFTPPEMEAQQTRELKDFVNEIRSQRRAGLRPGDQRR